MPPCSGESDEEAWNCTHPRAPIGNLALLGAGKFGMAGDCMIGSYAKVSAGTGPSWRTGGCTDVWDDQGKSCAHRSVHITQLQLYPADSVYNVGYSMCQYIGKALKHTPLLSSWPSNATMWQPLPLYHHIASLAWCSWIDISLRIWPPVRHTDHGPLLLVVGPWTYTSDFAGLPRRSTAVMLRSREYVHFFTMKEDTVAQKTVPMFGHFVMFGL